MTIEDRIDALRWNTEKLLELKDDILATIDERPLHVHGLKEELSPSTYGWSSEDNMVNAITELRNILEEEDKIQVREQDGEGRTPRKVLHPT